MKRTAPVRRDDIWEDGPLPADNPRFRKVIFLLPNLFTASNLILGMLSIVLSFNDSLALKLGPEGHELPFVWSARLILIAIFADMMDGRVARATGTTSRFGVEFDSLADMVSFGMAPAMLIYVAVLRYVPFWMGVALPVFYVVCAAVRLARFNVQAGVEEKDKFMGLPSPAAAGVLASYVLLSRWAGWYGKDGILRTVMNFYEDKVGLVESVFIPILTLAVAFLMISTVRYPSMKKLNWEKVKPTTFVAVAFGLYLLFTAAEFASFLLLMAYLLWGVLGGVKGGWGRLRQNRPTRTPPK